MQRAYAAHNKDLTVVNGSSSGGIFPELAKNIINKGGTVFAVAAQGKNIVYKSAETMPELSECLGSKYVFAPIAPIMPEIIEQVKTGRPVLVTVSPCQAAAVKKRCGNADNLLITDFVCHGAPEPKFWQKYISELEGQYKSPVKSVNFRKKQNGAVWRDYKIQIEFENGQILCQRPQQNPYMAAFLKNASLRKACGICRAKGENRESDITLGDFWGVNKLFPKAFYPAGTSLIFINTPKGEKALDEIKDKIELIETNPDKSVAYNPAAVHKTPLHPQWEQFQKDSGSLTFSQLADKYCRQSTKEKARAQLSRVLGRLRK